MAITVLRVRVFLSVVFVLFRVKVSFDEALASGIIDRPSASYVDKKTGASFSCEKAVGLGLVEVIGAEVCSSLNLSECVERLYPPPTTYSPR